MIRVEKDQDYPAVDALLREAFAQDAEALLVERLRKDAAFDPMLSLVAEIEGGIIGHVLFSEVRIVSSGRSAAALALAPIAVRPDCQRRGVGTALIWRGFESCRARGGHIVVVVGDPDYYLRFGFDQAGNHGIHVPFAVPDEVVMVLELSPGALAGVEGTVSYPPAFDGLT